jgi:hypothetical protein
MISNVATKWLLTRGIYAGLELQPLLPGPLHWRRIGPGLNFYDTGIDTARQPDLQELKEYISFRSTKQQV